MSFLAPSDFIGICNVSVNEFTEVELQLYIDRFEERYLTDLLGCDMYADFVADLMPTPAVVGSVPQAAKFTQLFEAFCIDYSTDSGIQCVSEGMLEMLKLFIYYEWVRDSGFDIAITGATKNKFSNAESVRITQTRAEQNYNLAVVTYQTIQWYIDDNPLSYDYDNFNGFNKDFISWL